MATFIVLVIGIVLFDILAWRYGFDSRPGFGSHWETGHVLF